MTKRYRLWLDKEGKPVVIEVVEGDLDPEEAKAIAAQVRDATANGTLLILSREWEVRHA